MRAMKAGGIGGVEIQPVYPAGARRRGARASARCRSSRDEFLDALRFVADQAQALGLRMDLTLGSGWPFGGPGCRSPPPPAELRDRAHATCQPGERSVRGPRHRRRRTPDRGVPRPGRRTTRPAIRRQAPTLPDGSCRRRRRSRRTARVVLFFIASRTGMHGEARRHRRRGLRPRSLRPRRARPAISTRVGDRADGRLPRASRRSRSSATASRSTTATGPATCSRSSSAAAATTCGRHLPALADGDAPEAADVRHDWGRTLDRTGRRAVPGAAARVGGSARHAAARAGVRHPAGVALEQRARRHLRRRGRAVARLTRVPVGVVCQPRLRPPVTSSETWTWLHSPAFRATPLDMKAEADRHFLQGINQLIGHGWPYSPPARTIRAGGSTPPARSTTGTRGGS